MLFRNKYYKNNKIKICFFDINERKIRLSISNISKSVFSPFIYDIKRFIFYFTIKNINYYEIIKEIEIPNSVI